MARVRQPRSGRLLAQCHLLKPRCILVEEGVHVLRYTDIHPSFVAKTEMLIAPERQPIERGYYAEARIADENLGVRISEPRQVKVRILVRSPSELRFCRFISGNSLGRTTVVPIITDSVAEIDLHVSIQGLAE